MALSAHANARQWYELKKKQESKHDKTITAHDKAFKAAEKKTLLQLAQVDYVNIRFVQISIILTLNCFPLNSAEMGFIYKTKQNSKKCRKS